MLTEEIASQLLTTEDASVVKDFLNGTPVPSGGHEEDAINNAIAIACGQLTEHVGRTDDLVQLLKLAVEAERIEPRTKKVNLKNSTPLYHDAVDALDGLRFAVAERIGTEFPGIEPVLSDRLRHKIWSSRVAAEGEVISRDGPYELSLRRTERRDHWALKASYYENDAPKSISHHLWARTGHLSHRLLDLRSVVHETPDSMVTVLSVVVDYHDEVKEARRRDILPLATEARITDVNGIRVFAWSAWRQGASTDEALLPHIGKKVRLGDLILQVGKFLHLPTQLPVVQPNAAHFTLPAIPQGWTVIRGCLQDVYYLVPPDNNPPWGIELYHPDHYKVQLTEISPGDMIRIERACGRTQYQPPGVGD